MVLLQAFVATTINQMKDSPIFYLCYSSSKTLGSFLWSAVLILIFCSVLRSAFINLVKMILWQLLIVSRSQIYNTQDTKWRRYVKYATTTESVPSFPYFFAYRHWPVLHLLPGVFCLLTMCLCGVSGVFWSLLSGREHKLLWVADGRSHKGLSGLWCLHGGGIKGRFMRTTKSCAILTYNSRYLWEHATYLMQMDVTWFSIPQWIIYKW